MTLRDMSPCLAFKNHADRGLRDVVLLSDDMASCAALAKYSDGDHVCFSEFVHAVARTLRAGFSKHSIGVKFVFAWRDVLKIGNSVIARTAVDVVHHMVALAWSNEGRCNYPVNTSARSLGVSAERSAQVAVLQTFEPQYAAMCLPTAMTLDTLHAAKRTYFVPSFKVWNCAPFFHAFNYTWESRT